VQGVRLPGYLRPLGRDRMTVSESESLPAADFHRRLVAYYLDCIGHDGQAGVSVFAVDRYSNPNYAELPCFPGSRPSARQVMPEPVRRLCAKVRSDAHRLHLSVGYPVLVKEVTSRKGWTGCFVEPILTFALADPSGESTFDLRSDELPELNPKAVQSLAGGSVSAEELLQLSEELGLEDVASFGDPLEVLRRLRVAREAWPWAEPLDPSNTLLEPPLAEARGGSIYNRAILVACERSPYTQGLEFELRKLKALSGWDLSGTALGSWVSGVFPTASTRDLKLVEPAPLNLEQREAVRKALCQPLTVVTGPPGTGKSQVVTAIVINAAFAGQRVLVASKNNKAVDVVEARANSLGTRPILLRLGANELQARLAEHLSTLLASRVAADVASTFELTQSEFEELLAQFNVLDATAQRTVELRNAAERGDQAIDGLRAEIGDEKLAALRRVNPDVARRLTDSLVRASERAHRERQWFPVRALWFMVGSRRLERLQRTVVESTDLRDMLSIASPPAVAPDTVREWCASASALRRRLDALPTVRGYFAAIDALDGATPLEEVARQQSVVTERMARVSHRLWQLWLRLQPKRLTPRQRQALSEFSTVVQMIAEGGSDASRSIGRARGRLQQLFPEVSSVLPCWAVTSLSAKGRLPLEPAFFDLVVIDEASQCDIASALPLLYRSKRAVIIGDPMQLRHIASMPGPLDSQLMDKHGLVEHGEGLGWSHSKRSLFDRATALAHDAIVQLRDHHRSHPDIIEFSNQQFYQGNLRVATRQDRLRRPSSDEPAVRWIDVRGRCEQPASGGALNRAEAAAVLAELRRLLVEQDFQGTIGVVSPFRAQANCIRDLVSGDHDLRRHGGPSELLVDTVHRFQGDERDVIIFSPAYTRDAPDGARRFLKSTGNLFNVAITRARSTLIVVGDQGAAAASDIDHLAAFADYVTRNRRPSGSAFADAESLGAEYPRVERPERVSEWERVLYVALHSAGLRPIPQFRVEQYDLDLALASGERRLDIEVDGEGHRDWTGEHVRRDQLRNQRLIELGWDVMRFWVYQLRTDLQGCVDRVLGWHRRDRQSFVYPLPPRPERGVTR
jgi:very-short-patch-repair endonuclease